VKKEKKEKKEKKKPLTFEEIDLNDRLTEYQHQSE
jgi:hypothetical protein